MLPNTTGVEPVKNDFPPLPEDDYIGKITKIEEGVSFEKQNPYVQFEVTITEGEYTKRKVWKRCFFRGETEDKTKKLLGMWAGVLESLGMTKEQREATTTIERLRGFALDLPVTVYVTQREYNGKIQNDVSSMKVAEARPF